jgi:hypothetical protein
MNPSDPSALSSVTGCDIPLASESRRTNESGYSPCCERGVKGCLSVHGISSNKVLLCISPLNASHSDDFVGVESNTTSVSDHAIGNSDTANQVFEDGTCVDPTDGNDGHILNSAKPCGRKGVERKNFSKEVVDQLQSWFYSNISHP